VIGLLTAILLTAGYTGLRCRDIGY